MGFREAFEGLAFAVFLSGAFAVFSLLPALVQRF